MGNENPSRTAEIEVSILHVSPAGMANVVIAIGEEKVADRVRIADETARKKFLAGLRERYPGIGEEHCRQIEAELIRSLEGASHLPKADAHDVERPPAAELLAAMPADIRAEADAMLADEVLLKRVIDDVSRLGVAGERELIAAIYLIGTSRLLDRPLAAIVQGPSSSGKSHVIETTAQAFPSETVIHATQITPQALFHMPPGSLVHQLVVAGERSRVDGDEAADATRALREMLSSGKLSKLMPVKVGGRIETVPIEQDGPIAYVESTTLSKIFDEDANRCLLLTTDERPEQTRRIIAGLGAEYARQAERAARDRITQRHHALQRSLEAVPVVVPYAERLGELFNSDRVEARRAFPQMLSMIQASALLHQRQRGRDPDGRLVAVIDDYQVALRLLAGPMARLLGGRISDPAQRFLDRLRTWTADTFSTTDAVKQEHGHVSDRAVRGWLSELHGSGLIEVVEASKGPKPAIWRLADQSSDGAGSGLSLLPSVEDLLPAESFWRSGNTQVILPAEIGSEGAAVAGSLPATG